MLEPPPSNSSSGHFTLLMACCHCQQCTEKCCAGCRRRRPISKVSLLLRIRSGLVTEDGEGRVHMAVARRNRNQHEASLVSRGLHENCAFLKASDYYCLASPWDIKMSDCTQGYALKRAGRTAGENHKSLLTTTGR